MASSKVSFMGLGVSRAATQGKTADTIR